MRKEIKYEKEKLVKEINDLVINHNAKLYDMANCVFIKDGEVWVDNCLIEFKVTSKLTLKTLRDIYKQLK